MIEMMAVFQLREKLPRRSRGAAAVRNSGGSDNLIAAGDRRRMRLAVKSVCKAVFHRESNLIAQ